MSDQGVLSANVRRLRHAHRWTQQEAADRLGISRRLVVQIEAGRANPSLTTLLGIANGFAVELTEILADGGARPAFRIQHDNASAEVLWSTVAGSAARLLVGMGPLEVWSWTLAPGEARRSDAHRPRSLEAVVVRAGALEIAVGDAAVALTSGQSVIFAADRDHEYRNPSGHAVDFDLIVFDPVSR